MPVSTSPIQWPLAAREPELAAFEAAWRVGRLRAVVVCGLSGVGKSRLAEELGARVAAAGWTVGIATATAAAGAIPLGALAHLLPAHVDLADPVSGFADVAHGLAGRKWVIRVDDLHLLDAASAVLLRQLMDAGLVRLLGTVRSDEQVSEAVDALCGGDAVLRIDLSIFDLPQVKAVLGAALGGAVADRAAHFLHAASGGNALYLRELTLGALAEGSLTFDGEIWQLDERRLGPTPRLAELIRARLDAAPREAVPVLELLALCEPLPLDDAEAVAQLGLLTGLESAGLIAVVRNGRRTTLELAHPLYAEVLRAGIPALRRRELLLEQIARTRAHGAGREEDTLRIATWELAATGTAEPDQLLRAAGLARYAKDYERAAALLEAIPDSAQTTGSLLMLGEVLLELGHPRRAERALSEASAAAKSEQDVLMVAVARVFSLMWSAIAPEQALAFNEAARSKVTDPARRAMLRHSEGAIRIAAGDARRGLALLDDLADTAEASGDSVAWLTAAMLKPVGLVLVGRPDAAMAFAEHARAEHRQVNDGGLEQVHPAHELSLLSFILAGQGRLDAALEVGERSYAALSAAGLLMAQTWLATHLGAVEWLAGRVATARRRFAEAFALARDCGAVRTMRASASGLAACAAVLGDLAAAERAATDALTHPASRIGSATEALGPAWLAATRGDLAGARALLADAAAEARALGQTPAEAMLLTDIARFGGAEQVAARLGDLAAAAEGLLVPAQARFAAALAADDPRLLLAGADELGGLGANLMAAEAATAAVTAWRRTGDNRRVVAAGQRAEALAGLCERAHTPLLAGAGAAAPLTARQRDIALMAAHGTPSRDIAEALHLSVRTVENHLHSAYAKLGVSTRRELADALGPTGLDTGWGARGSADDGN